YSRSIISGRKRCRYKLRANWPAAKHVQAQTKEAFAPEESARFPIYFYRSTWLIVRTGDSRNTTAFRLGLAYSNRMCRDQPGLAAGPGNHEKPRKTSERVNQSRPPARSTKWLVPRDDAFDPAHAINGRTYNPPRIPCPSAHWVESRQPRRFQSGQIASDSNRG